MACGAGLPRLALTVVACHVVVVLGFPKIIARLPKPVVADDDGGYDSNLV
jgi:hypothetical protein